MSITRSPRPEAGFYILDKKISEDRRLSWEARGMLVYLLGKPDYWVVSIQALINETVGARKQSGRDSVRAIVRELIDAGYIRRELRRDGDAGKLSGYDYTVCEYPIAKLPETGNPATVNPATDAPGTDYPATAKPATANPRLVSNETSTRKEVKQVLNISAHSHDDAPVETKLVQGAVEAGDLTASSQGYSQDFEDAWAVYPKRTGSNSKRAAFKAWTARMKTGETAQSMLDGVLRYAAFIQATGKGGTEYVKQAATFFGPDKHFLESWEITGVGYSRNGLRPSPHALPTPGMPCSPLARCWPT
jgi:hypothetical protein